MWSRSTKQRRAAMRRRHKRAAVAHFWQLFESMFRGRDLSPLIYEMDHPATTWRTPPKEQDWQLVTDAEPFRYLDTPLPARTWRGTIAVPPKEPK